MKKFVEEDCPKLMHALKLPDLPLPLWWTADFINASLGECWTPVPDAEQTWVVHEFNCSCVGVDQCHAACCTFSRPAASWEDVSEEDKRDATIYGNVIGQKAAKILRA